MESTRQQKFARLIQREVSDIFSKHGKEFFGNAFVTITKVNVTPDLGLARINMSMFKQTEPQKILEQIQKHKGNIRKLLGIKIKNTIHHIPDLEFFVDSSLDYVEKMDNIFKHIEIPEKDSNKVDQSIYKKLDDTE